MSPLFVEHIVKIRKDKMIRTKEITTRAICKAPITLYGLSSVHL